MHISIHYDDWLHEGGLMIDTSQDGGVTRAQALGMGAAALGAAAMRR